VSRLLLAEIRRVTARRLVRLTVVLACVGVVLGGVAAFALSGSLSEAEHQQRVRDAEADQRAQQARVEACLRAHGVEPGEEFPEDVARECFPADGGARADDPRFRRTRLKGVLQGVSGVLAVVGWGLGASLVGAEFASRSMTTTLVWEPRRVRVFVAKSSTAVAAAALLALGVLALVVLAMAPSLAAHGAPLRPSDPSWTTIAGVIGRGVALTAIAAGVGFAIATVGRSTAAALGAGFAYIIVLENILGSSVERWRRWLLLGNVIVFVSGDDSGGDVPGRSVVGAGVFLAAVALTLLVAAGASFRTRDLA
jgi:hypothetical protein